MGRDLGVRSKKCLSGLGPRSMLANDVAEMVRISSGPDANLIPSRAGHLIIDHPIRRLIRPGPTWSGYRGRL